MSKIIDIRLRLRKDVNGDNPLYGEIVYDRSESHGYAKDAKPEKDGMSTVKDQTPPEIPPRAVYAKYNAPNKGLYMLVCVSLVCCMFESANGCDQVLYISSKGTVCVKDKCQPVDSYLTTITRGQLLCFNDFSNNILTFELKKTKHITRYGKLYRTCSYNITTEKWYNCKGSGSCWEGNRCTVNYELNLLKKTTKEPHGYGCQVDVLGCDSYCHYSSRCVWYRWQINPNNYDCGFVYGKISEYWSVDIETNYKGIKSKLTLTSNIPFTNMKQLMPDTILNLPLIVNTFTYEKPSDSMNILYYGGKYYGIHASPINMPQENIIGDFQISIDKEEKMTYSETHLPCTTAGCVVTCAAKESAIKRLTKNSPYLLSSKEFSTTINSDGNWLNKEELVSGTVTLTFGNIRLRELVVIDANCRLNIIMNYACYGCLEKPYSIITSDKISSKGALEFISNCTWNVPYLQCSEDPYMIKQISGHKTCRIELPKINQTLDFNFDYIFRGEVTAMRSIQSESLADIAKSLGSDPNFWGSLVTSLTMMPSLTTIGTMLIKLARLGVLSITKKEADKA